MTPDAVDGADFSPVVTSWRPENLATATDVAADLTGWAWVGVNVGIEVEGAVGE
jgi:hypothetical protein